MRSKPSTASESRPTALLVGGLLGAIALSILAAVAIGRTWLGLPGVQLRRLTSERYTQVVRQADATLSDAARQGLIAANVSTLLAAAQRDPTTAARNRDTLQKMIRELRGTQLGRLQQAAFLILDLEQAGIPAERWWPTLEPVLRGLERAKFAHFLPDLIAQRTAVFEALGFGPGSARVEAEQVIGHPHGPFLQFFVSHLRQLEENLGVADPSAAALCQGVARRLLRQWVLDPAPSGLRLLAADLLAEELKTAAPPPSTSSLAYALREWRKAYHASASARPSPISPLSLQHGPELCFGWHLALAKGAIWLVRISSAAVVSALVAVAALAWCLRSGAHRSVNRVSLQSGALLAVLAVGVALVLSGMLSSNATDDLRRWGGGAGWPREPWVVGGLTAALLGLAALLSPRLRRARYPAALRVLIVAAPAWLLLSAASVLTGWETGRALADYEEGVRQVCEQSDPFTGLDASYTRMLEELRAWDPNTAGQTPW